MSFTNTEVLLVVVTFQLLFISVYLFTATGGSRLSTGLLGAFFLALSLNLIDGILLMKRVYLRYPAGALWTANLALTFGPLLYLYTQSSVDKNFRWRSRYMGHFVPFGLLTGLSVVAYRLQSEAEQRDVLQAIADRRLPAYVYGVSALIYGQFLIYLVAALRLIHRYRRLLTQQYASVDQRNLRWLTSTIYFFIGFFLVGAFNGFIELTPLRAYCVGVLTLLIIGLLVFINQVLFKALRRPDLFTGVSLDDARPGESPAPPVSPEVEAERRQLQHRLLTYMAEQKPYLAPDLSLDQLAGQLDLRPKLLSQVINESLGQNFFDFVNRYRIDEAKRLLTNPKDPKMTVLEVMYAVGFNSKSSFNTLFKKQTGLTPSEFKRSTS